MGINNDYFLKSILKILKFIYQFFLILDCFRKAVSFKITKVDWVTNLTGLLIIIGGLLVGFPMKRMKMNI